ncbi:MAG: ABC transporter ATP-binding protein [Armatimonadota bacterium]
MRTIHRLLQFVSRYWLWIVLTLFCTLAANGLALYLPKIMQRMIDESIEPKQYALLPILCYTLLGLSILKGVLGFGAMYLTSFVAQRTTYDIRNRLFDHIQRLSFTYHDEAETGQLISRSTSDIEALLTFLGDGITNLTSNVLIFFGVLILCLVMNWQLALVALSTMPFLVTAVFKYSSKVRPIYTAIQDQYGRLTTSIQQNLVGIRVVKAFAREEYEISKFAKESKVLLEKVMDSVKVNAFYGPMMDFIAAAGTTFILWFGGMQVVNHRLTIGEFVAFNTYLSMIIWPVRIMGWVVNIVQNAIASANRIFEVLDTHPETHLKDGKIEMQQCKGEVEFRDVSFVYQDGSRALSKISFKAEPGEMVAFLGGTGSGKSTLINLIPRFYDATEGSVFIDGHDVKKYRLGSLRRFVGIVSQETFLFGDSVKGNIAYARPDASLDDVIEAAKAANIHDFIASLPEGYETHIGERGVNLSGGQKQRIAIARALLMNPPILIMDDSTSAVDTETESMIQKALVSLTESRTTFVIAQRISTIRRADKIVVLDKGRVVEIGKHDELLAKGGLYCEIYNMQLGSQSNEGTEQEVPSE